MTEEVAIRFLPFAGARVAYAVAGDGPPVVAPAWWVSHLERDWEDPAFRAFWGTVGAGCTLVRYDRLGVGLSDRDPGAAALTLDDEVAVLAALIDELGFDRVTLAGGSSAGCAAIAYAARVPERVDAVLLYGAYADGSSIGPPEVRDAVVATVRSHWGLGSRLLADIFLGDATNAERERFARHQRAASSPEMAAALLELAYRNDVRADLRHVRAPTVVVHRRGDRAIPYRLGRELAAGIPGASLLPVAGTAHFPWVGDWRSVARALRSPIAAGTRPRLDPSTAALSRRELEVLALVASGLSDQEVAGQLVLSQHTVHRHVANIRTKLGCGTRAAAVAEAARLGLL